MSPRNTKSVNLPCGRQTGKETRFEEQVHLMENETKHLIVMQAAEITKDNTCFLPDDSLLLVLFTTSPYILNLFPLLYMQVMEETDHRCGFISS